MNIENKERIIDNLFDNKSNLDNFKKLIVNKVGQYALFK